MCTIPLIGFIEALTSPRCLCVRAFVSLASRPDRHHDLPHPSIVPASSQPRGKHERRKAAGEDCSNQLVSRLDVVEELAIHRGRRRFRPAEYERRLLPKVILLTCRDYLKVHSGSVSCRCARSGSSPSLRREEASRSWSRTCPPFRGSLYFEKPTRGSGCVVADPDISFVDLRSLPVLEADEAA